MTDLKETEKEDLERFDKKVDEKDEIVEEIKKNADLISIIMQSIETQDIDQ